MYCYRCGSAAAESDVYCSVCGINLSTVDVSDIPKKDEAKEILDERYEILKPLKSGGMGSLYKARDLRLGKIFVIKELKTHTAGDIDSQTAQEWFQREAGILCSLRHPHIPVVTDFFSEKSRHFIVMDYIEGESLCQESLPLEENQVLSFALEALQVLDYLHSRGIIHRDIKTEHFIREKSTGAYFLVDFGSAREAEPSKAVTAIGTQGFASPEHYQGKADCRSDIYSLGAVLHHLLTGINPLSRPPFSFETLEENFPHISQKLKYAVNKALAYSPQERFQNAQEMLEFLKLSYAKENKDSFSFSSTGDVSPKTKINSFLPPEPEYISVIPKEKTLGVNETVSLTPSFPRGRVYWRFRSHELGYLAKILFLPPGNILLAIYSQGAMSLWDIFERDTVDVISRTGITSSLCLDTVVSPDGSAVAQAYDNGKIVIWDVLNRLRKGVLSDHKGPVKRLAFRDNETLISGGGGGKLIFWNTAEMKIKKTLPFTHGDVSALRVSSNNKTLTAGSESGIVFLWNLQYLDKGTTKTKYRTAHEGEVTHIAFLGEGEAFVSTGADGIIKRWYLSRVITGDFSLRKTLNNKASVNTAASHPGGEVFITGDKKGVLSMIKHDDLHIIDQYFELQKPIASCAFSQKGGHFAAASEDGEIVVWE